MRILRRGKYVYPDASVVCGGPQFDSDNPKEGLAANLELRSVKLTIPLAEGYQGVEFDPPTTPKISD